MNTTVTGSHASPVAAAGARISIGHESPKEQAERAAANFLEQSGDLAIAMAKPLPLQGLDRLLQQPGPLDRFADAPPPSDDR